MGSKTTPFCRTQVTVWVSNELEKRLEWKPLDWSKPENVRLTKEATDYVLLYKDIFNSLWREAMDAFMEHRYG